VQFEKARLAVDAHLLRLDLALLAAARLPLLRQKHRRHGLMALQDIGIRREDGGEQGEMFCVGLGAVQCQQVAELGELRERLRREQLRARIGLRVHLQTLPQPRRGVAAGVGLCRGKGPPVAAVIEKAVQRRGDVALAAA